MAVDDSYTKALLHFDGADASTTFTDESGKSWTVSGNAQIDTAQSKFGGASGLFDGNGDYISTATSADFSLNADFTIDCWIRPNALANDFASIFASAKSTFAAGAYFLLLYSSDVATVGYRQRIGFGSYTVNPLLLSTNQLSTGNWYHVAVTRAGTTCRLFVNGAIEDTETNGDTFDFSNTATRIASNGWDGANSYFNGWIDELRVSKGIARWITDFNVPTMAYPLPSANGLFWFY